MVTLALYVRDLPPNEGGQITNNNVPSGFGRGNVTLLVFIEEHFIQSFIQSTSFQVIYTMATLICIDLST